LLREVELGRRNDLAPSHSQVSCRFVLLPGGRPPASRAPQEIAAIGARKQKGRDDALVVLHPMLADMLRRHRQESSAPGTRAGRGPVRNSDRVFRVSSSLLRWLKLDAVWAAIGLCDGRGRSTIVHGIRAAFNTTLRRNSTDPSLRMRLMRLQGADLGMGTYDQVEIDDAANSNGCRWLPPSRWPQAPRT
jgi:hypothetical protein